MLRHRRLIAIVAVLGGVALLASCADRGGDDERDGGLRSQRAEVGGVEIVVQLQQLDSGGVGFDVALDTHSGSLDADLELARLSVGGKEWRDPSWVGDGPGGHHREGELRFTAGGPPEGAVRLELRGFDEVVVLSWPR